MLQEGRGPAGKAELSRHWLRQCLKEHPACCNSLTTVPILPTRVIDLGGYKPSSRDSRVKIIHSNGQRAPYCALSYRWPPPEVTWEAGVATLTVHNFYHVSQGFDSTALVPEIEDACRFTKLMGFRYLWVDALVSAVPWVLNYQDALLLGPYSDIQASKCIAQGFGGDWNREAKKMIDTYTNATATIVLVDGTDIYRASAPTIFLSQASRVVDNALGSLEPEQVYELLERTGNFAFRPEGVVDSRGWTFQEKLLSRRIISITKDGVFWDCLHHSASDRRPTGILGDFSPGFRDTDDRNTRRLLAGLGGTGVDVYQLWRKLIHVYSRRRLTNEGDKLIAIDGITRRFSILLEDQCYAGIWAKDAVRLLLWFTEERRIRQPEDPINDIVQLTHSSSDGSRVPSWSWAKMSAPIEYRLWHPHGRHASGVETFTELAAVEAITARPRSSNPLCDFDGLLRIEGSCTEALQFRDAVFVRHSRDFSPDLHPRELLQSVEYAYSSRSPWNENPHTRVRGRDVSFVFHVAAFFPDSGELSSKPQTVRLLLLAKGGYTDMHVGQYCLVLARGSPGRYQRVGICVFDTWQVCLSVPEKCASCDGLERLRNCRGKLEITEIE